MHEARLYKKLDGDRVQCRLCSQFCVIEPGARGVCGVRENREGTLFTLVYDKVAAINLDPVEKKPLYHFQPGTRTFSLGTMGCNLRCLFCQNASLSQPPRLGRPVEGRLVTPRELVDAAIGNGARSISYTYSEPTIFFELMADTAALAHEQGLSNIMVSNGFMSPQCLEALDGLIDAANIDLKAFTDEFYVEQCGARLKPVLENLKAIKAMGWWLEVTTLVIPGLNDSEAELRRLAAFIGRELGEDVPWHVSRFHPQYKMSKARPTPVATLEAALAAGRAAGLKHVYMGNVAGNAGQHTLCPGCGITLVERNGFSTRGNLLEGGACSSCGARIAGRWE